MDSQPTYQKLTSLLTKFKDERAKFFFLNFATSEQKRKMFESARKAYTFALKAGYANSEIWLEYSMFTPDRIQLALCTAHGFSMSDSHYQKVEKDFFNTRAFNSSVDTYLNLPQT